MLPCKNYADCTITTVAGKRYLVPTVGVEPTQLALQPPQGCVSTNSTTSAFLITGYVACFCFNRLFNQRLHHNALTCVRDATFACRKISKANASDKKT